MKLASCKSVLNPPVVYSTDCSKAVVPVSVLLFVATRQIFMSYRVILFFSPFSITIISLGEERANLCAFRTFV